MSTLICKVELNLMLTVLRLFNFNSKKLYFISPFIMNNESGINLNGYAISHIKSFQMQSAFVAVLLQTYWTLTYALK